MNSFAAKIIAFYRNLRPPPVPSGIDILFPQKSDEVMALVQLFFNKFYNDTKTRRLIFGINPGRFGAGTTGINFTAPKQLRKFCGIEHSLKEQSELSAEFIYELIMAYGGVDLFYGDYFLTAVSPLGFVKNGKNMNYYDDGNLQEMITPFIIGSIKTQIAMGFKTDFCVCIGGDKNLKYLSGINEKYAFFQKIVPLPHPRFIMQYRRKRKDEFIDQYLSALRLGN